MVALAGPELGHRGGHAELLGVGRVDSANQRLHNPLVSLTPETARGKVGQALVGLVSLGGSKILPGQAKFAGER